MSGVFVSLFWIWTIVSVLVLLYRWFTTGTVRNSTKRPTTRPLEGAAPAVDLAAFEAKLAAQAPSESTDGVDPVDDPTAETDPNSERVTRAETLAEALTGIQMPAGLVPFVSETVNPRRALFTTSTTSSDIVNTALAGEFERLGFELQRPEEHTLVAIRADAAIDVRILASAQGARAVRDDPNDAVPEHAVLTELRLR